MQLSAVINFQEARDFGGKMNATYVFLRQHFKGLAKSLLFFAAPFVLLGSAMYHEILVRMINLSASNNAYTAGPFGMNEYFSSVNFYLQLFAALIFLLIGGVFTVSTTYAYVLVYEENPGAHIDLGDIWRKARRLFWSNLGTMFLYYVGMALSGFVLLIPVGLLISIVSFISPVFTMLCFLAYYIMLIALCVYFAMLFFIRCRERIGFFSAMSRLFALARQKFWNTVVFGSVNLYIQIIFSVLFVLPWYIYLFVEKLHNVNASAVAQSSFMSEAISTVLLMIYALASILLTALPLIGMAVQYYNLVELKEAKGLMARIERFGQHHDLHSEHEDF